MPHYYIDPVLPAHVTQAIAADHAALRGPRLKNGTIKSQFQMKLTESDQQAWQAVEDAAQSFAQVSASNLIRRAVRYYNEHLVAIANDPGEQAVERRALQNIPTKVKEQ